MQKTIFLLPAAMVLLLSLAGCSRYKTYPVEGRVTFADGCPAANCWITLEGGQPPISITGTTDADGCFRLGTLSARDGAPEGTYKVVIVDPPMQKPLPEVSLKYASFETSGLEATIRPGPNRLEFQVERFQFKKNQKTPH